MSNALFLRPYEVHNTNEQCFEWALYDLTGGQIKYGASATLEIIDQTLMQNGIDSVDVTAFWPANAAFSCQVSLPGKQARLIQQALPFAVEEQVAQDIEQVHIALGNKGKSTDYPVVNVDFSLFETFFTSLNQEKLMGNLKAIHIDTDLIPLADNDLVLCISENQILLKGKDQRSISLLHENLIPYLDTLFLSHAEEPVVELDFKVQVLVEASLAEDMTMLIAEIQQYPNVVVMTEQIHGSSFEFLCDQSFRQHTTAINLCQGEFKITADTNSEWHKWKAVALIAGLGFLLQLGVFVGQGIYFDKQADEIGQQVLTEYRKIMPNSKRITLAKLPRIIKGKLNQKSSGATSGADFLTLLGEAGFQYKSSKHKGSLKFKSLTYNKQRGELLIEMQAQSFDQLESLKIAIEGAGLTAKTLTSVQEKDYVRGRISVSGA